MKLLITFISTQLFVVFMTSFKYTFRSTQCIEFVGCQWPSRKSRLCWTAKGVNVCRALEGE